MYLYVALQYLLDYRNTTHIFQSGINMSRTLSAPRAVAENLQGGGNTSDNPLSPSLVLRVQSVLDIQRFQNGANHDGCSVPKSCWEIMGFLAIGSGSKPLGNSDGSTYAIPSALPRAAAGLANPPRSVQFSKYRESNHS